MRYQVHVYTKTGQKFTGRYFDDPQDDGGWTYMMTTVDEGGFKEVDIAVLDGQYGMVYIPTDQIAAVQVFTAG